MDKEERSDLPDEEAADVGQQVEAEKEDALSGFLEGMKSMSAEQQQVMQEMAETLKSFRPPDKKEEKKDDFVLSDFLPGQGLDEFDKTIEAPFIRALEHRDGVIAEQNGALKKMYAMMQAQEARLAKAEEIAQRSFETAEITSIGQDVWKTVNSKEFNSWMDTLGPTKKRLYAEIRKSGSPEEVAEMEQEYRTVTNQGGKQGQAGQQQGRPEVNQRQRGGMTMDSFAAPERESDGRQGSGFALETEQDAVNLFNFFFEQYKGDSVAAMKAVSREFKTRMQERR
jgi:hypothetical protein